MTLLQKITRNIATSWVGLFINIVISFFLAPFVVNKLGSTYYGLWAITMQFTGYLYLLDFGVRDAVVRYSAKFRAKRAPTRLNEVIRVALEVYFPVFIGAIVLSLFGAWVFPYVFSLEEVPVGVARLVVLLVGLTIAQTFLFNVFVGVLHGFQRFDIGNYIGIFFGLLRALLIVITLNASYGIVGLSIVQLGVSLLGGLVGLLFALSTMKKEGFEFKWVSLKRRRRAAFFRRIVGFSIYVFINNIGQKTSVAAGPIIIGLFLPVSAVAPYAIAGSLASYAKQLIGTCSGVFSPVVSHYAALNDVNSLTGVVRRGAKLAIVVGLPVIIAYILVGDLFIGLWMGPDFVLEAGAVLIVLALTELVSAPHHVMAGALYGMSKHQSLAFLRVLEACANIGLSVILIQKWGIVGVAIGAAIPHMILVLFLLPLILCKHIQVSFLQLMKGIFIRPILGAIPFAMAINLVYGVWRPDSLVDFFVKMFCLLPVYGVSLLLISLEKTERDLIANRIRIFYDRKKEANLR